MDRDFNLDGQKVSFVGDKVEIVDKKGRKEEIKYNDLLNITFIEGEGGLLKDKVEGKIIINSKKGNINLEFKKSLNNIGSDVVKFYKECINNEVDGKRNANFLVRHQIGLESRKQNECELYVYDNKIGFGYNNSESQSIEYNNIKKIELVEHMQFMNNVSVGSALVLGALAAATSSDEELFIIDLLVITLKGENRPKKIVFTQSENTEYDVEYIYNVLNNWINKEMTIS